MKLVCRFLLMAVVLAPQGGNAQRHPAADLYQAQDLQPFLEKYRAWWPKLYRDTVRPQLTPLERSVLDLVPVEILPRDEKYDPISFYFRNNKILVSARSVKFLDDLVLASTWLERNGYTQASLYDYLMMLRYWSTSEIPPKPLMALCIPSAIDWNKQINEQAIQTLSDVMTFIVFHELGHALEARSRGADTTGEASQEQEAKADRFALDLFSRIGASPGNSVLLFVIMSALYKSPLEFEDAAAARQYAAMQTHPTTYERMQAIALSIAQSGRGYRGNSRAMADQIAQMTLQLAMNFRDPSLVQFLAANGQTVRLGDLAPRRTGQFLARSCSASPVGEGAFDGIFRGQITVGNVSSRFELNLVRNGNRVTGSYFFGLGYYHIEGNVKDNQLEFRWNLNSSQGRGVFTQTERQIVGSWAPENATIGKLSISAIRE